jgi:hypothetical protein
MEWNSRAGTQAQPGRWGRDSGQGRRDVSLDQLSYGPRLQRARSLTTHQSPRALPSASVESSVWSVTA